VVLGEVARDAPLVISTKSGRLVRPGASAEGWVFVFSGDGIRASVEESLARLGLPRVDILMIHDPDDHMDQAIGEAYPALRRMKDEGLVGAIGAGMVSAPPLARFVRETELDCVLLAGRYTLLDQSALEELLPLCTDHDVSVILGGVFNGGLLAGSSTDQYNYAPVAPEVRAAVTELAAIAARHEVSLKAAAIQFPFFHPAIACVLSGTVAERHLVENVELLRADIPAAFWEELRASGRVRSDAPIGPLVG
jgi:D-threo-aldose 1-dehydrogenase